MRLSTGSPALVASAILCSCEMRADLTCLTVSSAAPRIALSAGVPSFLPCCHDAQVLRVVSESGCNYVSPPCRGQVAWPWRSYAGNSLVCYLQSSFEYCILIA